MSPDPARIGGTRPLRLGSWRGERDERFGADLVATALRESEGPDAEILKSDERSRVVAVRAAGASWVVKEVRKAGTRRRLADALRGSPARRAWRAGRRLIASGVGAALPIAFLERRVLGVPVRSRLVSLDLRGIPTAAEQLDRGVGRQAALFALADLAAALHRSGAVHGDLRAQHVHLGRAPLLIDLESIRFRRRPGDAHRIRDLAQLNASIPDAAASGAERRAALLRYADALPFAGNTDEALQRIERDSVARGDRYSGAATG